MRNLIRRLVSLFFVWGTKGEQLCRYYMYSVLKKTGLKLFKDRVDDVLSISYSKALCEVLQLRHNNIVEANFPEHNVLNLQFSDNSFNVVLLDQVFEHIQGSPFVAANEIMRVLKPGGYVIATTCFIFPIHGSPNDYWRFTPDGLRLIFGDKVDIIENNGWGNKFVWLYNWLGCAELPVPSSRWNPINVLARYNEKSWPIVTWLIARKKR